MYFWKISNLKADLIEQPATERESLPYLIATWVLWVLTLYLGLPADFELKFFLNLFVVVVGTIYGTYWLYKINDKKDNNYFLQRYIMLSWVVMIRYIAIFSIPLIVFYVFLATLGLGNPDTKSTSWADVVMNLAAFAIYYWYFGKHLAEVAQNATYD